MDCIRVRVSPDATSEARWGLTAGGEDEATPGDDEAVMRAARALGTSVGASEPLGRNAPRRDALDALEALDAPRLGDADAPDRVVTG